jgi:hypothetical protein
VIAQDITGIPAPRASLKRFCASSFMCEATICTLLKEWSLSPTVMILLALNPEKITALHTCLSSLTHVGSNCSTISPVPKGFPNYVCDRLLFSSVLPMLVGAEGPLGSVYRGTGTFLAFLIYSSFLWEIFLWSLSQVSWVGTRPGSLGKFEAISFVLLYLL